MPKLIIDSWAWVEYLEGSKKGETVRSYILDEENEIYTNILSLAEIISVASRKNMDISIAINVVTTSSVIINIDEDFCRAAGIFHGKIRKDVRDFGLGDAFVVSTARRLKAKILTGDPHFKGLGETILI